MPAVPPGGFAEDVKHILWKWIGERRPSCVVENRFATERDQVEAAAWKFACTVYGYELSDEIAGCVTRYPIWMVQDSFRMIRNDAALHMIELVESIERYNCLHHSKGWYNFKYEARKAMERDSMGYRFMEIDRNQHEGKSWKRRSE